MREVWPAINSLYAGARKPMPPQMNVMYILQLCDSDRNGRISLSEWRCICCMLCGIQPQHLGIQPMSWMHAPMQQMQMPMQASMHPQAQTNTGTNVNIVVDMDALKKKM